MPAPYDSSPTYARPGARPIGLRWQHEGVPDAPPTGQPRPVQRYRRSPALTVAAIIVIIAGTSVASWAPYLLPLLLIPLVVAIWSWRSGTDAGPAGLTVRAAMGSRRLAWDDVRRLSIDPRGRVVALLASGGSLVLSAVPPGELSALTATAAVAAQAAAEAASPQ
jgi:PH (Pleckstrin Homology) domain-containing protein